MNRILQNWNVMRFIRLGLGLAIIVQAVITSDWMMGILGLLFTLMPVFNIGCCATGSCNTPVKKNESNSKDINYEELV